MSANGPMPPPPSSPTTAGSAPEPQRRLGVRSIAAGLCLVLATILLPIGGLAFWGQKTLTDTERFMQTVQPLASDPVVIEAIADTVTKALTANVNLESEVQGFLPPIAAPLAGPISSAIPSFVKQLTIKVLSSEQFQQIWTKAIGSLQTAMIKALEGDSSGPVSTTNGQVVLDTGEVIDQVKKVLGEKGLTAISDRPTPPAADRQVVLLNSDQLAQAQTIYSLTKPIATWLIVFVLLLFLGAIGIAHRRARMVAYVGVGILIGAGIIRFGLAVAPDFLSNSFEGTPFAAASVVFFNTLTSYLLNGSAIFILVGILLVVGGWAFSDQKLAVQLRDRVSPTKDTPAAPPAS